jgi:hypothetical protein
VYPIMQDLLEIQYQGRLYKYQGPEWCSKSIYSDNEENYPSDKRNLEDSLHDIFRQLTYWDPNGLKEILWYEKVINISPNSTIVSEINIILIIKFFKFKFTMFPFVLELSSL